MDAGTAPRPTVRFADDSSTEAAAQACYDEDTKAIHNLCQTIKPSIRATDVASAFKLGYLESRARTKILLNLDPEDQVPLQSFETESLEIFVKDTARRDARLKVGRDLVLSILGLGTSCWTPATWTAKDVFLVRDPAAPIPQPYFRHACLRDSLCSKKPRSPAIQTRESLFALGVLLLELVFRDQLENQPFRAALMGADMKPTAATDLATALLWQQKVEEELGHELADAIKRCLVCMFDQAATPDLGNPSFVQAVWQQVVRPIESFLSAWNRN